MVPVAYAEDRLTVNMPTKASRFPRMREIRGLRVAVAAIATIGVAVAVTSCSSNPPGAQGHTASLASLPITATSSLAPVTGDVHVVYYDGTDASAEITGKITHADSGDVVRLYAQQFPYTGTITPAGALTVHPVGGAATYAFRVTPTLATRYQVKLFPSSTATSPVASSATTTIYVTIAADTVGTPSCGRRPVCHLTRTLTIFVPPSALKTEMNKPWYVYLGVNLSPAGSGEPPAPASLQLGAGDPVITKPQLIAADQFTVTIKLTFNIGNGGYHYHDSVCTKDTEAQDGIGLPGSHGCGSERIPTSHGYLS